jgi:hypothetical protein
MVKCLLRQESGLKVKSHKYVEITANELLEKFNLKGIPSGFTMTTKDDKTIIRFDLHE